MKTILLLSYLTSPYKGSEAAVSWNFITAMQHTHRFIVIYGREKEDVDDYLKANAMPNVSFVYVKPNLKPSSNRLIWLMRYAKGYKKWHKDAFQAVQKICKETKVDVIHYLNPIGFREPGYLYNIKNIPYVWGPITGVHERPWCMRRCINLFGKFEDYFMRNITHKYYLKFGGRVKAALKHSDVVLAATKHSQMQLERYHDLKTIYLPENGIPKMERISPISLSANVDSSNIPTMVLPQRSMMCMEGGGNTLVIIWIGAINARKNLIVLLEALNKQINSNWRLDVIGDGNLKSKMQKFCTTNNMSDRVIFHGSIPREKVFELINSAHLHIVSSLGEGNPTTIWEAMANGVPTMTLDHCGMADVVCDKCGIKIPINSYNQVVDDMANHIARLIENPSEIERMSKGVLECSKNFMYENRIALFDEIYESITKNNQ